MFTIIIALALIFLSPKLIRKIIQGLNFPQAEADKITKGIMSTYNLVMFLMILLGVNTVWYNIMSFIDNLRTPEGLLSFIGVDPILSDVLSFASVDELGIPTSPRMPDLQLMMDNVTEGFHTSLYSLLGGIALMALYFLCCKNQSKAVYMSVVGLIIMTFLSIKAASAGIIHIGNFCFSGVFNPYTGNLSDSMFYPVLVIFGCVMLLTLSIGAFSATKAMIGSWANVNSPKTPSFNDVPQPPRRTPIPAVALDYTAQKECPICGETILAVAKKCKHCHEYLDVTENIAIKECPICGEDIPADADICPYCKEKVK